MRGLFWTKFNSEQLLFQAFFHVMRILAALSHKVNLNFHFCTLKDFKGTDLLSPLAPPRRGDRHMRSRTFLEEIQFRTTFISSFFLCDTYFWQRSALNL